MSWFDQGKDPDYRFSLANERTFLAWIRTALAILAGAVILHQLSAPLDAQPVLRQLTGALSVIAAIIGGGAFFRWRANELAMRLDQPLPRSSLIVWLAITIVAISAGCASWMLGLYP